MAVCLTGLAVYFYRESSRELREAATRVNFVNQVSHELRTPLTNICLYADLLEHDLQFIEPTMAQKAIEIRFHGNAPDAVQLDVDALEQILVNLLSNVEKYAASGGLVEISTRQNGDRTIVEIADHGPGIARDQREKIFQPFYRMSDRLEGAAGAGIGLSIVRNLARLHGGDVYLLDRDTGATFRVELLSPKADDAQL